MKVLVIGGGGREHALCWKIAQSPRLSALWCAPGNAGIASVARCVPFAADDLAGIEAFARESAIDLVVVGPEAPLALGLADRLRAAGIAEFGPGAAAAQLETSKGFTKDLCARAGIPTARYARFDDPAPAKAFVADLGAPIVVKADGLAAGKGVVIAQTVADAHAAIDRMFAGAFGAAGAEIVVETFLEGEEASFFALCDGATVLPLATAQDYKRAYDGDEGPNTGGMGAYSPAPIMTDAMVARTMAEIVEPTVRELAAAGTPYNGVLYAGLMINADGPQLIEYNVRFGDPECQVLMPRLDDDLLVLLAATAEGRLAVDSVRWCPDSALTVVMAAQGYPQAYEKGSVIRGLAEAAALTGVQIFHAGTGERAGEVIATGGRVLSVTACGADVAQAQARAYAAVDRIDWPEGFCRRDIGWRALARGSQGLDALRRPPQ